MSDFTLRLTEEEETELCLIFPDIKTKSGKIKRIIMRYREVDAERVMAIRDLTYTAQERDELIELISNWRDISDKLRTILD